MTAERPDNWPDAAPTLTSERLTLRAPAHEDAPALAAMFSDIEFARMTSSLPPIFHPHAADGWVSSTRGYLARGTAICWVIVETATQTVIGTIDIFRRKNRRHWELGYGLRREFRGHGHTTEAARLVMNWAQESLRVGVFVAGHFADNPASGRVLEKLGFIRLEGAEMMYSLARGEKALGYRYIWPADRIDEAPDGPLH